jgi:hypothetical protein
MPFNELEQLLDLVGLGLAVNAHLMRMPRVPAVEKAEAILEGASASQRGLYVTS